MESAELYFFSFFFCFAHKMTCTVYIKFLHYRKRNNFQLQGNLYWKTAPLDTKIWCLKTGGIWQQVHLYWKVGLCAPKLVVCQDRWSLMAAVSQDRFHCIVLISLAIYHQAQVYEWPLNPPWYVIFCCLDFPEELFGLTVVKWKLSVQHGKQHHT